MTCYLFVPGGKRTADDWDAVRAILDGRGHRTGAITLSDPEQNDLSHHVAEVCTLIERHDARNVHLVGHSYASFVITGVADRLPERIGLLGYVDTLIPRSGRSLFDFFRDAGVDPAGFGVPAWPPFVEHLTFDTATIHALPKCYVHCLRSQFLSMTRDIPTFVKSRPPSEQWRYFDLDSDHYCMIKAPQALADIIDQQ